MTAQERLDDEMGRICRWLRARRLQAHVDRQGRVYLVAWSPERIAREERKRKHKLDSDASE